MGLETLPCCLVASKECNVASLMLIVEVANVLKCEEKKEK